MRIKFFRIKILDRYFILAFLRPFAVCIGIFSILVCLGRFFDKMQIFTNFHASTGNILLFIVLSLPYWLGLVMPVATLIALLFSLGQLQQRGEVTAFRNAGIPSLRLYAPFLGIGVLLSLLFVAAGLTILPRINFQSRIIYRQRIKHEQMASPLRDRIVVAGQDNRRFSIGWLDASKNEMRNVVIDYFAKDGQWLQTLSAKRAEAYKGQWRLFDGNIRRPDPNQERALLDQPFTSHFFDIPDQPSDFLFEDKIPEDMTAHELLNRIRRLRASGASYSKEQTSFHLKIALPFANLVVILLGIPYALKTGQKGKAQTFGYSLVTAFLYWGVVSVGQSFGEQGQLPAWFVAWLANFIFVGYSIWMLRERI